jgi:glutathione S-transferase
MTTSTPVVLHGYHLSVYNRVARMALHEKGVLYETVEVNPFEDPLPDGYLDLHPFRRVPVLSHGGFRIYETTAITRYIDDAFDGPPLVPVEAKAAARMTQAISIIDSYGYWPMVREVFVQRVSAPEQGERPDEEIVKQGVEASRVVLGALETLAAEGLCLDGKTITLADCHLAPMFGYFTLAPEGAKALAACPALSDWWSRMSKRSSYLETEP